MDKAEKRPWWRHWHVDGHFPWYSLREAREVARIDLKNAPWLGEEPQVERCDIDHLKEAFGEG